MNDHITKPIDPTQLYAVLAKWISASPAPAGEARTTEMTAQDTAGNASDDSAPIPVKVPPFPDALDGYDLVDGLKRLQGNKILYLKLLKGFAAKYAQSALDIRRALDARNYRKAHGMLHDIKGLAGNLAAISLQAVAAELEKRIKHADEKNPPPPDALDKAFAAFETRMDQALRSARQLESPADESNSVPTIESTGELPPDLAREAAGKLREAAEMGDVSGLTAIAEELAARSSAFAPYQRRIAQLIDDFDFEGILGLANDLEKMPE
jgi:two-component system, sensor histidine kinase and response regulator